MKREVFNQEPVSRPLVSQRREGETEPAYRHVPTPLLRVRQELGYARHIIGEGAWTYFGLLGEALSWAYSVSLDLIGTRVFFIEELLRRMEHSRRRYSSRHQARQEELWAMGEELQLRRSQRESQQER